MIGNQKSLLELSAYVFLKRQSKCSVYNYNKAVSFQYPITNEARLKIARMRLRVSCINSLLVDSGVVLLYIRHADGRGFPRIILHGRRLKLYGPDEHVVVTES